MTRTANRVALGAAALLLAVVLGTTELRVIFLSGAGIAQGALIAAIALGVVLTFRGSGVVNLANGTVAMYAAYTYAILRSTGDLFLPPLPNPLSLVEGVVHVVRPSSTLDLPDIPTSISFGAEVGFWPALVISLGVCVLLGLGLHLLVYRPLRHAPPVAKVVASVGVFLLLQAIILRRFSIGAVTVRPMTFVDKTLVDLGVTKITQEQLFVAVLVIVFSVVLWWVFARTTFGLATRAASENQKGAVVLGFDPDRLAGLNWVLSTVITGLLGIFVASINANVDPIVIPALIVPALTAALVGGFQSFGVTTLSAFLLGMQVPLIQYLGVQKSWFPKVDGLAIPGVETIVPFIVIVVVLFVRGNALPGRGDLLQGRLPFAPVAPAWTLRLLGPLVALAIALGVMFWFTPAYRGALSSTLAAVMLCLSVVVVTGFVGQISLAPMAFAGISAFTAAALSRGGLPFPLPILIGGLVAAVVGVLVALPALRVRGVNLAIVTLAFGLAVDRFVFSNGLVNGGLAGAVVDTPQIITSSRPSTFALVGGLSIGDGKQPNPMTALFALVVTVLLCVLVANLRRSTTGRRMLAVRANERAAAAAGVDVAATKALAFAISAFIAGIAGAIIAYRAGAAVPGTFTYQQSLLIFAFAYLGGLSRVSGAVVGGTIIAGGLFVTWLDDVMASSGELALVVGALALISVAILQPEGIAGGASKLLSRARRGGAS